MPLMSSGVTKSRPAIAAKARDARSRLCVARGLAPSALKVGTATVYRTLELLTRAGFARAHEFGEGFRRFEAAGERGDHEHLVCLRCGKVVEFTYEHLARMLPVIADEHSFRPERHRVEIFGTCRECLRGELEQIGR